MDVVQYDPKWVIINGEEYLLPLDDFLDRTWSATGDLTIRERCTPIFIQWIQEAASDGTTTFGVPTMPVAVTFLYNVDLFEEAGITSTPNTWDEFLGICQQLVDIGTIPFILDDAYMDLLPTLYLGRMKGEEWVRELVHETSGEMWRDPAVLQMAQAFDDMRQRGFLAPHMAGSAWPAGQNEVGMGEIAMYLTGNWLPNELMPLTGPDFRWGMFPFPSVPGGVNDNSYSIIGAQGYAIPRSSPIPELAFEFITYFNADETEADLAATSFDMPVTPFVEWPEILAPMKGIFDNMTGSYVWGLGFQEDMPFQGILVSNFTRVIGGTLSPEDFVEEMVAAGNR